MSTHSSDTSKDDAVTQTNAEDSAGNVVMQRNQSIQVPTSTDAEPPADAMASVPRGSAYQTAAHSTGAVTHQAQEGRQVPTSTDVEPPAEDARNGAGSRQTRS